MLSFTSFFFLSFCPFLFYYRSTASKYMELGEIDRCWRAEEGDSPECCCTWSREDIRLHALKYWIPFISSSSSSLFRWTRSLQILTGPLYCYCKAIIIPKEGEKEVDDAICLIVISREKRACWDWWRSSSSSVDLPGRCNIDSSFLIHQTEGPLWPHTPSCCPAYTAAPRM